MILKELEENAMIFYYFCFECRLNIGFLWEIG